MNYKNNYITKEDPINQYINYFSPFEKMSFYSIIIFIFFIFY